MNVMWKLTIEDDEGSQTSLQLASAEYHIGRDEGNNVRLTDRNVSRRHATLKRNGDEVWHLVDHESYNGSFVNGQRVAGSASLGHADLIQLGDYRIFLTNEEYALAPPSTTSGKPPVASVPPPPEYPDRLVVLVGPEPGFECRLDRGVVTIGRSEECTFAINHPSVSRVHAVVHPVAPGRFEILDKDSANGLRINGVDMRRKILEGGDVIELGDVQMRYFEQGQAPRLGSDISQRLRALSLPADTASELTNPSSERSRRPGKGRWVAAAMIGLAALGAGIIAFQTRPKGNAASTQAAAAADDGSNAIVEKARAASRANPGEALRLLATLPEGSARRRAPDVAELANQAAEALLAKVAHETDLEKRSLALKPLQAHPLVDAERRRQAAEMLKPLEPLPPAPVNTGEPPTKAAPMGKERLVARNGQERAPPPPAANENNDGPEPPNSPRVASARIKEHEPRDREAIKPAPRPKENGDNIDGNQVLTKEGEAATRRQLEGRMQSGKASVTDIRLLQAICRHDGDTACMGRTQEAIRKLSE